MARAKKTKMQAPPTQNITPSQVVADEMTFLLNSLQTSVGTMQKILDFAVANNDINLSSFAKISKIMSDILDRIYKIRYGKAAQEEMLMMIGDLQRHITKIEEHNAEKERRARSKPLIDIVGQMAEEDDLAPGVDEGLPEEYTTDQGSAAAAAELELRKQIESQGT